MAKEYEEIVSKFLSRIKNLRPRIGSIYLFGSHARGTARPDSDYDLLLVVPKKDKNLKDKLYDAAVDIFMDTGADISLKIVKKDDFDRLSSLSAPFVENVLKEGVKLG